ncbi:MAG TPA: glycosyltransferase family 4 protein [Candidimonas sp.]|nr:glycosyltransferase family 4 protein [Candidimonas sp.]
MVDNYQVAWRRLAHDYSRGRRLLFVVNNPAFFLSHRLPLALGAMEAGFEVHVATMDGPSVPRIVAHGLTHHVIPMTRSGKHPLQELHSIYAIWRLFRRLRPAAVHAVTIKPVLYGGIAARLAGVPAYIAAISGLGFVFSRPGQRLDLLRWAATALYKLALGHPNSRVIFQNHNDRDVLHQAHVVRLDQTVLIRGSGVDLAAFPAKAEPEGPPVAIMVARLLVDKGVREFVQAARLSAGHPSGLRWMLVGSPDPGNPASITEDEYALWRGDKAVECLGERSDIAELYAQSHIVVLPSYREGLPKSLVEAAACGRAVVTTDVPGCRDAIEPGVSGLLVPPRNVPALAHAVLRLADDPAMRVQMGEAGRRLAEQAFDVDKIAHAHVELYRELTDHSAVGA